MAKSKKKRKARPAEQPVQPHLQEDARANAVTVCWMITALLTFCAEMLNLVVNIYLGRQAELDESFSQIALLGDIGLFSSLITGAIALILTPAVYQFRRTKPPKMITIVVLLISVAPGVSLMLQQFRK